MTRTLTRTFLLCLAIALLILSDCFDLLGSWAVNLKFGGLVLLAILCVFDFVRHDMPRGSLLLGLIAFGLLVGIIPLQQGDFSPVQAIGLFAMVFLLACLSGQLIQDSRQLAYVALFTLALVLLLLLISNEAVRDQLAFYAGIGRPRFQGCFSNPNSLGFIASMIMVMLVVAYRGRGLRRGFFVVALIVTGLLLLGSGSRTAWFATGGMLVILLTVMAMQGMKSTSARVLTVIVGVSVIVALLVECFAFLSNDVTFQLRAKTLLKVDFADPQTLVGIGYVSSEDIRQVTSVAGGDVDMLIVSLLYRVGIVGVVAYVLFVIGALVANRAEQRDIPILCAMIAYVVLQSVGESYLSSVMSFVSAFDWIMLASAASLAVSRGRPAERPSEKEAT